MLLQRFLDNEAGRDFIVGDLHGCTQQLRAMLQTIDFDPEIDRLFSVGDLIDRGPYSLDALELLKEPWFHAVRGNHEDMLMTISADPTVQHWNWWIRNGGRWAYELRPDELAAYAAILAELPLVIVVGSGQNRFNLLHAEWYGDDAMLDAADYDEQQQQRLMWGRSMIDANIMNPLDADLSITYVGHTIVPVVTTRGAHTFIDTGCFKNGVLTMIEHATGDAFMTVTHADTTGVDNG